MNSEYLKTVIDEFKVSNSVTSYYITYKTKDNITHQKWGKITELDALLDEISKSDYCISDNFPILKLIIYAELQCLIFIENEYYDCVNGHPSNSFICETIPYIDKCGDFGHIESDFN